MYINSLPPQGLNLNIPGLYILKHSFVFDHKVSITISVSDVLLDMNHNIITYNGVSDNNTESSCIVISPNVTNVSIINGTITNFYTYGIIAHPGCKHLWFEKLDLDNNGRYGSDNIPSLKSNTKTIGIDYTANKCNSASICLQGEDNNIIEYCYVKYCNITNNKTTAISIGAYNVLVEGCSIKG